MKILAHLYVKKIKLYLLFILNKILLTIIIFKLLSLFIFNKKEINYAFTKN